ncbi:hypothetical protein JIR001_06050 [Polycladomyces abyssicola]|uniref:Uncharacterized protein n=1 Tax=Polycladomyces abyssicola TaxID=1125966 RepID=A0A8D5ZMG3_9BACL|nr:hypothetical protein JIR001_06050 [Polycladomyces abyssicola]
MVKQTAQSTSLPIEVDELDETDRGTKGFGLTFNLNEDLDRMKL